MTIDCVRKQLIITPKHSFTSVCLNWRHSKLLWLRIWFMTDGWTFSLTACHGSRDKETVKKDHRTTLNYSVDTGKERQRTDVNYNNNIVHWNYRLCRPHLSCNSSVLHCQSCLCVPSVECLKATFLDDNLWVMTHINKTVAKVQSRANLTHKCFISKGSTLIEHSPHSSSHIRVRLQHLVALSCWLCS